MEPIDQGLIREAEAFLLGQIQQQNLKHPKDIADLRIIYDDYQPADESAHDYESITDTTAQNGHKRKWASWTRITWLHLPLTYSRSLALDYMSTFPCVAVTPFKTFPGHKLVWDAQYQETIGAFNWLNYTPGDVFNVIAVAKIPDLDRVRVWLAKRPGDSWRECGWIWEKHCSVTDHR